ncbi:MAG: YggS family pyridoxal phosphate-dependent enzyme [Leptolyngbyaceae bacterium]|nr:YggS family pyridoxal phosphate-dependent enzyme [Leptolyngbyaceae bacterium]
MSNAIAQHILHLRQGIPDHVRLIAVTKQVSVDAMRAAYDAGVRDFGESRIQEAEAKQAQLEDLPGVTWHFIGHLQSNKAKKALEHFQWIHSLDSLALAQRLDQLAVTLDRKPQVCLQVKILPDPSKFGWSVSELWADLPALDQLTNLQIEGLMTIPPAGLDPAGVLQVFQQTQELATQIRQQPWLNLQMRHLSMGMSGDYPLAIQAGATMIRPGRLLFGDRD